MPDTSVVVPRFASDERLVEAVSAGSERAFEALFERHHREVLAFCRQMLGSSAEAEDAAQLTFLAAYRELARSKVPLAPRPWLFAIARNRCLAALRARRERLVEVLPEPASEHLGTEVIRREELRRVLADVARLPDDQRAALVLSELGDVSHEDIARILACQQTKVKALVFQARASLAATREARDTPCAEIREQLATLRGAALRRTAVRRHLRDCARCRAYRDAVRAQRRGVRALVPIAPAVALKRIVIEALVGSEGAATAATAGGVTLGGLAATALVTVAIPVGGLAVSHDGAASGRDDRADHAAAHAPGRALDPATPVATQRELRPRGGALRSAVVSPQRRRGGHATASSPARPHSPTGAGCAVGGCPATAQRAQDAAATGTGRAQHSDGAGGHSDSAPSSVPADATPAARPMRPARPAGRAPRPASAGPPAAGRPPAAAKPAATPSQAPNPPAPASPPAAASARPDPKSVPQTGAPSREDGSSAATHGGQRPAGAAAGAPGAGAAQTSTLAFLREDGYR
jgi:RNA polymerase sigma factor (sigma-70 family)